MFTRIPFSPSPPLGPAMLPKDSSFQDPKSFVPATLIQLGWKDALREPYIMIEDERQMISRFERCPLLSRGWVLQERLLSRRVLHFTREQLIWECCDLAACENYPKLFLQIYSLTALKHWVSESLANGQSDWQWDRSEILSTWCEIVQTYSKTALTIPTDKMPALSGVAALFRQNLLANDDEYLAGLWRSFLPTGLLWSSGGSDSRRTREYVAPSWSWASLDGEVWFGYINHPDMLQARTIATVLDVKTTRVDENPYGQVTKGFITIRAPIVRCRWKHDDCTRFSIPVDVWCSSPGRWSSGAITIYLDAPLQKDVSGDWGAEEQIYATANILLIIFLEREKEKWQSIAEHSSGGVLEKVKRLELGGIMLVPSIKSSDVHRRIGKATLEGSLATLLLEDLGSITTTVTII